MKKDKLIIIAITIFLLIGNIAGATNTDFNNAMSENKITVAEEKDEVLNLSLNMEESIIEEVQFLGKKAASSIAKNKMYKVYDIVSPTSFMNMDKSSSFKNVISNEYTWEVPIIDSSNNIVSTYTLSKGRKLEDIQKKGMELSQSQIDRIKQMEGKWDITLVGNYMPIEGLNLICNSIEFEKHLLNNGIETIDEIKIVKFALNTYVIYIADDKNEYAIVYNMRPEFINMENGRVYEMSAFIENFQSLLENQEISGEDMYSGNSLEKQHRNDYWLYVIGIAIMLIVGSSLMLTKKRKSKNKA